MFMISRIRISLCAGSDCATSSATEASALSLILGSPFGLIGTQLTVLQPLFDELDRLFQFGEFLLLESFLIKHIAINNILLQYTSRPDTKLSSPLAVDSISNRNDGIEIIKLGFCGLFFALNGSVLSGVFQNGTYHFFI